jgi:hypothetical protein
MSTIKPIGGLIREHATRRNLPVFTEHIVERARSNRKRNELMGLIGLIVDMMATWLSV